MAEPYDLTPIKPKKLKKIQKGLKGKGGSPGQLFDDKKKASNIFHPETTVPGGSVNDNIA